MDRRQGWGKDFLMANQCQPYPVVGVFSNNSVCHYILLIFISAKAFGAWRRSTMIFFEGRSEILDFRNGVSTTNFLPLAHQSLAHQKSVKHRYCEEGESLTKQSPKI
jgi:hypothetical protein